MGTAHAAAATSRHRAVAAACGLLLATIVVEASAAPTSAPAAGQRMPPAVVTGRRPPTVVAIGIRAQQEASKEAFAAIRGHFSDLEISLQTEWVATLPPSMAQQVAAARRLASKHRAVAVFWADFSLAERVFLYLAEPGGARVLVRNVRRASAAERAETLAIVARNAVRTMVEGGQIGVKPAPRRRKCPACPSPPRRRLAAELGYEVGSYAAGSAVDHGLRIGVALRIASFLDGVFGLTLLAPATAAEGDAATTLRRYAFSLGARAFFALGRFRLGGTLLAELEVAAPEAHVPASGWRVLSDSVDVAFSVTPGLHAELRLLGELRLFVAGLAQVVVNPTRYVFSGPAGDVVLLAPRRFQPSALLGVAVPLF